MSSLRLECFGNPNPCLSRRRRSSTIIMAALSHASVTIYCRNLSLSPSSSNIPRGLGLGLGLSNHSHQFFLRKCNRTVFSFAASHSHEESASDIHVDKDKEDLKAGAQESQEAWQQALASFKEQALKMQSISKEAYHLYSEKAIIILKETSENLKIQAEKARLDLSVIAEEIAEESREYLTIAAENSPDHVKDIVETFAAASPEEFNDVSKIRDFYVGIPYGAILTAGGFLSFMLTGSIPAIRFGIILGGTLLALSISSLRSWKKGESSPLVLQGQTAIATILFLRELRLLSRRPFLANFFTTLISGGVVAFYIYRIITDGGQSKRSNLEVEPEN